MLKKTDWPEQLRELLKAVDSDGYENLGPEYLEYAVKIIKAMIPGIFYTFEAIKDLKDRVKRLEQGEGAGGPISFGEQSPEAKAYYTEKR